MRRGAAPHAWAAQPPGTRALGYSTAEIETLEAAAVLADAPPA